MTYKLNLPWSLFLLIFHVRKNKQQKKENSKENCSLAQRKKTMVHTIKTTNGSNQIIVAMIQRCR